MTKIEFEIKDCQDCPFCETKRMYTGDSWEHAFDYFCKKADNKQIATYIEWRSEMPEVPDWCPCRRKN